MSLFYLLLLSSMVSGISHHESSTTRFRNRVLNQQIPTADDYLHVQCEDGNYLKVALRVSNNDNCVYQGPEDGRCGVDFTVQATKNKNGSVEGILRKEVWEFDEQTILSEVEITCMEYIVSDDETSVDVYVGGYVIKHPEPSYIGSFAFTALSGGTMDEYTPTLWPAESCEDAMQEFLGVPNISSTIRPLPERMDGNLKITRC